MHESVGSVRLQWSSYRWFVFDNIHRRYRAEHTSSIRIFVSIFSFLQNVSHFFLAVIAWIIFAAHFSYLLRSSNEARFTCMQSCQLNRMESNRLAKSKHIFFFFVSIALHWSVRQGKRPNEVNFALPSTLERAVHTNIASTTVQLSSQYRVRTHTHARYARTLTRADTHTHSRVSRSLMVFRPRKKKNGNCRLKEISFFDKHQQFIQRDNLFNCFFFAFQLALILI